MKHLIRYNSLSQELHLIYNSVSNTMIRVGEQQQNSHKMEKCLWWFSRPDTGRHMRLQQVAVGFCRFQAEADISVSNVSNEPTLRHLVRGLFTLDFGPRTSIFTSKTDRMFPFKVYFSVRCIYFPFQLLGNKYVSGYGARPSGGKGKGGL